MRKSVHKWTTSPCSIKLWMSAETSGHTEDDRWVQRTPDLFLIKLTMDIHNIIWVNWILNYCICWVFFESWNYLSFYSHFFYHLWLWGLGRSESVKRYLVLSLYHAIKTMEVREMGISPGNTCYKEKSTFLKEIPYKSSNFWYHLSGWDKPRRWWVNAR